jgi:thiamine biosynthesis lipoprotein
MFRFTFDAIGTAWEIETPTPLEIPVRRRILERIERFEAAYSRFRPDSLVSRIASSRDGGCFTFPADAVARSLRSTACPHGGRGRSAGRA